MKGAMVEAAAERIRSAARGALDPLRLFAAVSPKDPARRVGRAVAFGPEARHRLDVYAPRRRTPAAPPPVAVFYYGGSWDSGGRADYNWVGRALASRGFLTVVPDYGLHPAVRYPDFLADSALAVRWVQDHAAAFGGDPERIVLVGHSAGAYNAAMVALDHRYLQAAGVEPARVRALAGLAGPYDFLPLTDPIAIRTFGEAADLSSTQPTAFAGAHAPPAFLAHGTRDAVVWPRNTRRLARALRNAGAVVEERHYEALDHVRLVLALSRPFRRAAPVLDEMAAFLRAHAV
jgi:acetyl esterase/lipase